MCCQGFPKAPKRVLALKGLDGCGYVTLEFNNLLSADNALAIFDHRAFSQKQINLMCCQGLPKALKGLDSLSNPKNNGNYYLQNSITFET